MSNFFSNLFGGGKNKSKKSKEAAAPKPQQNHEKEEDDDNINALNRRLSLSKSGRMKEKKRSTISVATKTPMEDHGRKPSLPGSDVFDVEGIEKAEKESNQNMNKP